MVSIHTQIRVGEYIAEDDLQALLDEHIIPRDHTRHSWSLQDPAQVFMCPGCQNWSIEIRYDHTAIFTGALEAANEHRNECPALDMLAGLRGLSR